MIDNRRYFMRSIPAALAFAIAACCSAPAFAQWQPNGTQVTTHPEQLAAVPVSDGHGGAYFMLADDSDNGPAALRQVRLQRRGSGGELPPGWVPDGLSISDGVTDVFPMTGCLNADGSITAVIEGGVLSAFWAQRVRADGTFAHGWPSTPVLVARVPHHDVLGERVAPAPNGANLFVWYQEDGSGSGYEIFEQMLDSTGTPLPGWPLGGRSLIGGAGDQTAEFLFKLPGSGYTLVYRSTDPAKGGVFACRLHDDGSIDSSWAQGSVRVVPPSGTIGTGDAVPDGLGGYYYAWADYRDGYGLPFPQYEDYYDIYLQRVTPEGTVSTTLPFGGGWSASGLPICVMPGRQWFPKLAPDGSGGVFVAWGPNGPAGYGIHAQHVLASSEVAPGWPADGKQMFGPGGSADYPVVASDGVGGLFVVPGSGAPLYAQHVSGAGQFDAGWSNSGYPISDSGLQDYAAIVGAEPGSAIVCWWNHGAYEVLAQKLVFGGVVAANVSLQSDEVASDHVTLVWDATAAGPGEVSVERRSKDSADWSVLATTLPDGAGRVSYRDLDVHPGSTYSYRLAWIGLTGSMYSAETAIAIPTVARFALAGATPNPTTSDRVAIRFSLASNAPASLELFDIVGRRVASKSVGTLGAGSHLLRVAGSMRLPAGVYLVRLNQGDKLAVARVLITD